MVACAGKGHGEQHRIEAGEPARVEIGKRFSQSCCQDAVGRIEEQIARDQRDAGIDHRGHIAKAQDIRALDIKVLREQHDGNAHHIYGDHQTDGELERVPHIAPHVARKEKADDRQRVAFAGGVGGVENACKRVQARHEHEAEEKVGKQNDAEHPHHERGVKAPLIQRRAHHSASCPSCGAYAITSAGLMTTLTRCPGS